MASPATLPPEPHEVPLREARVRLPQLAALTRVTGQVTVLTDGTGPVAALVPVDAARGTAQSRADDARVRDAESRARAAQAHAEAAAERSRTVAAGWARRMEEVHASLTAQHEARLRDACRALAQAWAELDDRCPPGTDPHLDRLRAAHAALLAHARPPRRD